MPFEPRVAGLMRGVRWLQRGPAGGTLFGANPASDRLDRLRSVAGAEGGVLKRAARVAFYLSARAAARLPGASGTGRLVERGAPRLWRWLARRNLAYIAAAEHSLMPRAWRPEPPNRTVGSAVPGLRTRKIHQLYAGANPADAIVDSMLLIQRCLRERGYASDIFAADRDPRRPERSFEIDDIPSQDDYILIIHHAAGDSADERVASLPARKILIHHTVSPAALADDAGELERRQLSSLRPQVAAALADSEIGALELRSLGYDDPVACPLLFDIDALIETAGHRPERLEQTPFTILFVGPIAASKGQADLVDAFAEFRRRYRAPCRLVLAGSAPSPDEPYARDIAQRTARHGVRDEVLITGAISGSGLRDWYRAADLYVSLSRHEDFGVPLVAAMAQGVPVLAWPAGAVPYTLGSAGELLPDRSPDAIAAAMLRIARDPAHRAAIVAHQRGSLRRFSLDRHLPRLLEALARAGAAPPLDRAARRALAANLRFTITGHLNGSYSLAAINRHLALALESDRPGTVRVMPWENGPVFDLALPAAQQAPLEQLVSRPASPAQPEIVISQHYPTHVPKHRGSLTAALMFWEESLLSRETVRLLNDGFDAVLAPSSFVAKALIDSGVSIPVRLIGHVPDLAPFFALAAERASLDRSGRPFTFLHVSSCFPRKGVDVLIAAYAKAFRRHDKVRLIVKGFPNPHNTVPAEIAQLQSRDPDLAEITVINRDMDDAEMRELYRQADAMVLPTRGEGFNLPAAEAMAAGLPLIVTGQGGHLDFCTEDLARFVDFRAAPSRTHLAVCGSTWAEPDGDDLAAALREAFDDAKEDRGDAAARAARARAAVGKRLDAGRWAGRIRDTAAELLTLPRAAAPRVAWVSSWLVPCGVAEYSRHLLERLPLPGDGGALEIALLCDDRTVVPAASCERRAHRSWRRGERVSMDRVCRAVSVIDADAVVIQYHPGLFAWSALASLLSDRRLAGRVAVVTLHATQRLIEEVAAAEREAVVAALRGASRVLVHRVADVNLLKSLGITANVALFPQGASTPSALPPIRSVSASQPPRIGCYGFFLPGKGIPRLIEAAAKVRGQWPGLRLRLVNAENPDRRSAEEIKQCRALATSLHLEDAIEWHTSFLAQGESLRLLSECDLVVLPYDPTPESSSAALRGALASGAPVAVTPATIFDEAEDAVHRIAGFDVSAVAEGIDLLLRAPEARRQLQERAMRWMGERDWSVVAARLQGMLTGLHVNKDREGDAPRGEAGGRDQDCGAAPASDRNSS